MTERIKSNQRLLLGGFLVGLLTIAAHWRGLWGQFVEWDDTTHVTKNITIRALTPEHWQMMFTGTIAKLYIPLTWLSFAVDYQIWGRDPFGYHLTNLVLHIANTFLVFVLVRRLLDGRHSQPELVALLTAALFGVHPLRVESVAWVTERKDVLFAFFYLLALGAYLRWITENKRSAYWFCFGCFGAATLAKATAVTLPVVLLLLDYFWARRSAWPEKNLFFAVSVIISAITFVAQASGVGETLPNTAAIPILARIGLAGYSALFYIWKFFWPFHLTAVYPPFDEMNWSFSIGLTYVLVFVGVSVLLFALRRRVLLLWPGWLFYLVTLSPTIGLAPAGIHVVADRFGYIPLLGVALPVAAGLAWLVSRQRLVWSGVAGLLAGLIFLSFQRTAEWHDTGTLFTSALRENSRCLPAHVNLTLWYTSCKQFDKAIAHGQEAVKIAPAGLPGRKNLAAALIQSARYLEAIAVLRPAVEHGVDDPVVWQALQKCFESVGDLSNAQAAGARYDMFEQRVK